MPAGMRTVDFRQRGGLLCTGGLPSPLLLVSQMLTSAAAFGNAVIAAF